MSYGPPSLDDLAFEINKINRKNGWRVTQPEEWDGEAHPYKVPAILHSEVSEALEAFRVGDRNNFEEELADVLIRLLDLCGGLGINLEQRTLDKMEKKQATCIPARGEGAMTDDVREALERKLFNAYGELFPNYAWCDASDAVDLMVAEIMAARKERDEARAALATYEGRKE